MSRTVFVAALVIVGLIGLALRLAPMGERRLDEGARELGASRWIVDDPGTALHLRRVELALAEGRVPQHDPFLAHGTVTEIPALPVYDALIAGFAEHWLAHVGGDPSLDGVDEADLEAFAAWIGPIAYLLGFLALAWAAWACTSGAHSAVLLAVAMLALSPIAGGVTEIGRLDTAAFVIVLLALLVRGTQLCVRAEDALSMILEALLCGVIAGLLTSMTAAGPLLALPTGAAIFMRAVRGPELVRPIAVRAGLLFSLAAAFISRLPLAEGPWEQMPEGLVARWALTASDVLLVAAAPFALLLLTAPRDAAHKTRTFARIAALAAMLALLVFELPRAWSAASAPLEAWWSTRSLRTADVQFSTHLVFSSVATVGVSFACVRAFVHRDAAAIHLALLAVATAVLAVLEPATASLHVAVAACAFAGAIATLRSARTRDVVVIASAVMLVLIAGFAHVLQHAGESHRSRDDRIDAFAAMRWIRSEVPPGGPFNSSSAMSSWGILADPRLGELIAYHARRPAFASYSAAYSEPERVLEAQRLAQGTDGATIIARMQAHGIQLAIACPALARCDGILGWVGESAAWEERNLLPGTTRLLPLQVPKIEGSEAFYLDWELTVVWSLEGPPPPREPSVVAPPLLPEVEHRTRQVGPR